MHRFTLRIILQIGILQKLKRIEVEIKLHTYKTNFPIKYCIKKNTMKV